MTTIYSTSHNLAEISLIGGAYRSLVFNGLDVNGTSMIIWGCTATWKLYHLEGVLDYPVLEKTVYPYGSNYFCIELFVNDTKELSGEYIQQISITDFAGKLHTGGRGKVIILPSAL